MSKPLTTSKPKTFLAINFGCRVNSAETNQFSQSLIDQGFIPAGQSSNELDIIFINTCAITKKGEYESISKIKDLQKKFPQAKIIATGCADLSKLKNIEIISKNNLPSFYTHQIKDKFSHTNRYLLKIQSGCTANCSYCIVPYRRSQLWSLPIDQAIDIANNLSDYQEIIITGVNLNQYLPGFSNLIEKLLSNTKISLISFGSIPINCVDDKFIKLFPNPRLSNFIHIPIQSGSDKILKLMHRPYNRQKIIDTFNQLKNKQISFGTDIIVGFPTETEVDFEQTLNLCQSIGFSKIHTFKYSPRPDTPARELFLQSAKISKEVLKNRSKLISQTTIPFHQTPRI